MEPIEPVAPPSQPSNDPASPEGLAHAERVVERFGGDPSAVREAGAPPKAPKPAAAAPAQPTTPTAAPPTTGAPPAQPPRSAKEIDGRFHERVSNRKRLQALEERNQLLEAALKQFLPKEQAAPAAPPPDFNGDPQAWYEHKMDEKLAPIVKILQAQEEERTRAREASDQQEQLRGWLKERSDLMLLAEEEYAEAAEGQGYRERLQRYAGRVAGRYVALGYSQGEVEVHTAREIDNLITAALDRRQNPAAYIDSIMRYEESFGAPPPAPAVPGAPPAAPVSPEIAASRAAAASGVAGSLSQAAPASSPPAGGDVRRHKKPDALKNDLTGRPGRTWRDKLYATQNRAK